MPKASSGRTKRNGWSRKTVTCFKAWSFPHRSPGPNSKHVWPREKLNTTSGSRQENMNRLIIALFIVLGVFARGTPLAREEAASAPAAEHPLILAQDQGEVRVWRPLVSESVAEQ